MQPGGADGWQVGTCAGAAAAAATRPGLPRCRQHCQPQQQLRSQLTIVGEEQVLWLDVAVYHAVLLVQRAQRVQQRRHHLAAGRGGGRCAA